MFVALAGCAGQKAKGPEPVIEKDVARVIKLSDGSTCTEPPSMDAARQLPGALQAKELFDSAEPPEVVLGQAKKVKVTDQEIEAAWFDVCKAYSKGEIKKDVFEKDRKIYLELRQALIAQSIKDWVARKDGVKEAGKLCMSVFAGDPSSPTNTTRFLPQTASVDDCALLAQRAGAADVLLGCTEGQWLNHWAKRTVPTGPLGMRSRGQLVRDTASAPDPNCGWM